MSRRPSSSYATASAASIHRVSLSSTPDSRNLYVPTLPPADSLPEMMTKSLPIHIQGSMKRTPSEVQLLHQEALADYKDYEMFERIVNGILQRTGHPRRNGENSLFIAPRTPPSAEEEQERLNSHRIVQNLIRTRSQPISEAEASPWEVAARTNYEVDMSRGNDVSTMCTHLLPDPTPLTEQSRCDSGVFLIEDL